MADQPGPSSSSAPEETLKTEEECKKLLYQGEVMIIRQRYPEAVDILEDVVKNLARIHGDGHDALGDAYLYYGRALLGMEQMDESLFQKNVNGDAEAEESSDDEEEEEEGEGGENGEDGKEDGEGGEGEEEEGGADESGDKEEPTGAKPSALDNVDLEEGENTDSPAPAEPAAGEGEAEAAPVENGDGDHAKTNGDAGEEAGPSAAAAEQEEQITNMQVAWEVTELARKIFLARGSDDGENTKKLGRAYATLAEIAMISGQFAESAADFGRAFDILCKTDDTLREQAEILYLRSNALVSCNRFDDAKEVLTMALDKLSEHQEQLRQKTDDSATQEIEEIESLKKQLSSKFDEIEIAREDIAKFREQKEKMAAVSNGAGSSKSPVKPSAASSSSAALPVHDISHLVRRRKKPDEEGDGPSGSGETDAKKPKMDGDQAEKLAQTNGTENEKEPAAEAEPVA